MEKIKSPFIDAVVKDLPRSPSGNVVMNGAEVAGAPKRTPSSNALDEVTYVNIPGADTKS